MGLLYIWNWTYHCYILQILYSKTADLLLNMDMTWSSSLVAKHLIDRVLGSILSLASYISLCIFYPIYITMPSSPFERLIWHLIIGLWPSHQGHPRQTNLHWWGTTQGTKYQHPKETVPRAKTPAHPRIAGHPETGEDVGQGSNHCSDLLPPSPPDFIWEGDAEDLCQAWYGGQLILWGPVHGGEDVR